MDRLIYTAVSGASRSLMEQQIRANNLANAGTNGFRADLSNAEIHAVEGQGYASRFIVEEIEGGMEMASGILQQTGRPLDVAIEGDGLIALQSGEGEVYTRNGNMQQGDNGQLTINGLPVLGDAGPIILPPNAIASIGSDGTISITPDDGDVTATMDVDRIKLVSIESDNMAKDAAGHIVGKDGSPAVMDENITLVAGSLESSNVSAVNEMVATLSLSRQFEAQIKMMKAAEQLSETGNRLLRNS
jgi:flagellar basal-body rod protein FlgF